MEPTAVVIQVPSTVTELELQHALAAMEDAMADAVPGGRGMLAIENSEPGRFALRLTGFRPGDEGIRYLAFMRDEAQSRGWPGAMLV